MLFFNLLLGFLKFLYFLMSHIFKVIFKIEKRLFEVCFLNFEKYQLSVISYQLEIFKGTYIHFLSSLWGNLLGSNFC